jgi:hypothetical protein
LSLLPLSVVGRLTSAFAFSSSSITVG